MIINWSWHLQSFWINFKTSLSRSNSIKLLFELLLTLHTHWHVNKMSQKLWICGIKTDVNQSAATSFAASLPVIIAPLQLSQWLIMCKHDRSSPTLSELSKRCLFFLALTRLALPHPPLKAASIHYSKITIYCRTVLSPIYSDKAMARVKGCKGEMFPGL